MPYFSSGGHFSDLLRCSKVRQPRVTIVTLRSDQQGDNLLFYSQFSCAIARFLFSNISVSFCLAFSIYFLSSEDGLNDLSMSIGSTRYNPDSLRTWDRTTYSQFLNIVASPPVGHDDTTITSFDIPCNLCPVVASLIFAGICIILQQNSTFFDEVL